MRNEEQIKGPTERMRQKGRKNKRAEKNRSKEPQVKKGKTVQRDSENGNNIKKKKQKKKASKCK